MSRSGQLIEVIVAAGSNLGDRDAMLKRAGAFLESISAAPAVKSSIWETDPVGPSKYPFLNAVARIVWEGTEEDMAGSSISLLQKLKSFERECGRPKNPERWGPRVLDLDIIAAYVLPRNHEHKEPLPHQEDLLEWQTETKKALSVQQDNLTIPHPEYSKRWFVLAPLQEIEPNWIDPIHLTPIQVMLNHAEPLTLKKTTLHW